ncbi:HNH endonuclease domain-containing protein [Faecalibacter sp. LW9]|uniref:HNH endonuclease domain-containing protein n=1 Tax=Faecalibacter sp. LW9 TaxID=3103144 RepID=UPI002AFE8184|nr:HNH endonuclease domain-containing protein [Faecalibacter sp. LW9]
MLELPASNNLPINILTAIFNRTTATYKFYWFLSIIELVEQGNNEILKTEIFSRMISNSWYTINYFHLSFGKYDLLEDAVLKLFSIENLTIDEKQIIVQEKLISSTDLNTKRILQHFDKNVPHWFLSPWFQGLSKADIYKKSQNFDNQCLYALYKDKIVINPNWIEYLQQNSRVLKSFCYWYLTLFLQTRNPNVPDIANKLIKPAQRNSLQKQTNQYWKVVFDELGWIDCIFTGKRLTYNEKKIALDHFIPYAFVSHDLIWNLIPIDKSFNSSKSDKLPSFERYFTHFKNLQKIAFNINLEKNKNCKYIEDYLTIFPSVNVFDDAIFENTIRPLLTIANNNGFLYLNE